MIQFSNKPNRMKPSSAAAHVKWNGAFEIVGMSLLWVIWTCSPFVCAAIYHSASCPKKKSKNNAWSERFGEPDAQPQPLCLAISSKVPDSWFHLVSGQPRSLRWKNKTKHCCGWFVVREKHYSDWKTSWKVRIITYRHPQRTHQSSPSKSSPVVAGVARWLTAGGLMGATGRSTAPCLVSLSTPCTISCHPGGGGGPLGLCIMGYRTIHP